jgi:hypothetical protein
MESYRKITIFNHPWIFFTDKLYTAWFDKKRGIYFPTIISWAITLLGLYGISKEYLNDFDVIKLLCSFLFIFGLVNVWLATFSGQTTIRNKRMIELAAVMHGIAEIIRDYRASKIIKGHTGLSKDDIIRNIQHIIDVLGEKFLMPYHRPAPNVTVKYLFNNKMYSIRNGPDVNRREKGTEDRESCHVFNVLQGPEKLSYLYVKDVQKPDDLEREKMGQLWTDIAARAKNHYGTFIAFPINTGNMSPTLTGIPTREALGILGIDYKRHFAIGNISDYEIQMLACAIDSLSEIVYDLIETEKKTQVESPLLTGR